MAFSGGIQIKRQAGEEGETNGFLDWVKQKPCEAPEFCLS